MIVLLETRDKKRDARIKLYKDDVFLIAQETIKKQNLSLSIEELFVSADRFTDFILKNDLSDREVLQYEIDDLREEVADEQTLYLLLALSYIKLCALRKVKPNAEDVARALVGFCQEYDGFTSLLKQLLNKERAWLKNKRADLLAYELKCVGKKVPAEDGMTVVRAIVDSACSGLSPDGMLPVENTLSEMNDKFGHRYQAELDRLREARKKKSEMIIQNQYNTSCQQFMGKMENPKFIVPQQDEAV